MTNQLLQSDIDTAQRMIEARHTDEEILEALVRRRVDAEKAVRVLSALRAGEKIEPDLKINYELGQGLPSHHHHHETSQLAAQERPRRRHRSEAAPSRSKAWIVWLVLLVAVAGAAAYYFSQKSAGQPGNRGFLMPPPPAETNKAPATPSPQSAPAAPRSEAAQ